MGPFLQGHHIIAVVAPNGLIKRVQFGMNFVNGSDIIQQCFLFAGS